MRALLIEEKGAPAQLVERAEEELLEGDVAIDVAYSSFNYKDGMALAGRGIVRSWPLIPGIDLVGRVSESASDAWSAGDLVILNGDGIGESRNGGFSNRARVRPDALVRLPEAISPERVAAIGTAGFTAMIAVLKLEDAGVKPESGDVLVTGAAGGVGSVATALLARRGYRVVAATGRVEEQGDYLRGIGAAELIDRSEFSEEGPGLQKRRWAGAVDVAGGRMLANVLAQTVYGGTVVACGLAESATLPTTVMPFILRDVTLSGANSVDAPIELRERAWTVLANEMDLDLLDSMTETIGLAGTLELAPEILAGKVRGRTVVDVNR